MSKMIVCAKCSDMCSIRYEDSDGLIVEHDGYVPSGLGIGDFGGDYVEITIDTKTGQIEGWKPLKKFQILQAMKEA
jgi:hypothetical protein